MVTIQIPKDIREYEPKFIGPFNIRQAVCLTASVVIEFLGVQLQTAILKLPTASYIPPLIIAIIPLFFGFAGPVLHMKPEVYLRTVFMNMTVVPKNRPYKTHNYYDVHLNVKEAEVAENKEKKKQKLENLPDELIAYK